ncbi:MAG: type I restriction endonuclease subunit R, EcoR124 family, partial [Candidatus Adiutrix sp.]
HRVTENVAVMAASKHNKVKERKICTKLSGFNAIFAVSNSFTINGKKISPIQLYYNEFKRQLSETRRNFRIAAIFSFTPNEETADEDFDNEKLDDTSRSFLDSVIADYNKMFDVNYDSSADKFQNYYKDLSLRMKNRDIDLLLVVNMFLTGFDATTLNTLWVDKNLKYHGLLQAFSRTNRILNSVKTFGNIVCFRNLKTATDEALSLFGDETAGGIVLLKSYSDYYHGYEEDGVHKPGYIELIENLTTASPLDSEIISEENQKDFIQLFGAILRQRNILSAFDDFQGNEILSERDFQDYQGKYIDLYQSYKKKADAEKVDISDDIVFEIELIKQIEVNIDYILLLVLKYRQSNCKDKTVITDIQKAIDSSIELRSKKSLIESFIKTINPEESDVNDDWAKFAHQQKKIELRSLIEEEQLNQPETERLMAQAFIHGNLKTTGTDIDKVLPPVSRFSKNNNREIKKQTVIEKLLALFEKFNGVV